MPNLLTAAELPEGFTYPHGLVRTVDLGLLDLDPWWILEGALLRTLNGGIQGLYPLRRLIVFAKRQDNDDVACFDLDTGKVAIVHAFASPGWERRGEFADFRAWLHQAIDDMINSD